MIHPEFNALNNTMYFADQNGNLYNWNKEIIPTVIVNEQICVEIHWYAGMRFYDLATVLLFAYRKVDLPADKYHLVEPLFIDNNPANLNPVNLTYRFKDGPIEAKDYPNFFHIPFYTHYGISLEGKVISLKTGKQLTSYLINPPASSCHKGGYAYVRLNNSAGESKNVGLHRLLCFTFKKYESNIHSLTVNHKDGEPTNNDLDNLELSTYSENNKHAIQNNLRPTLNIPFLVLNLDTNEINKYENQTDCAKALGKNNAYVSYKLRCPTKDEPRDRLLFKYDDGSDWKTLINETLSKSISIENRQIAARNVFTGEIIVFKGILKGEEMLGIRSSIIYTHVNDNRMFPYNGYNFRFLEKDIVWPKHSERHLLCYLENPIYPGNGIIVLNIKTNKEEFFASKHLAGARFNVIGDTIIKYIRNNTLVNQQYRFSLFSIENGLGPI